MKVIRIYTKEPRKPTSSLPMILKENSTVKNAAENILKGFSQRVKETRVTGPSSKFPNQKVGLSHVLDRQRDQFC
jgi:ribosome-interacting GTPase 1